MALAPHEVVAVMKVWVVMDNCCGSCGEPYGVFSSNEKAGQFINQQDTIHELTAYVFEVDELP